MTGIEHGFLQAWRSLFATFAYIYPTFEKIRPMLFLAFISGVLLWTFLEYVIHRFLGHEHKGKNLFKKEHLQHHREAHYFAPAPKKLMAALIVGAVLTALVSLLVSWSVALSFVVGLMGMYGLYEVTHTRFHKRKPLARVFIILRKHHFYHHFHQPKMNYGVTSRFWDRVFRTFHEVESVRVPKAMVMDWLMKGEQLDPDYQGHFRLA